ncbi:hypothetical protein Tco_1126702 [Tanacetum coccineum]
MRQTMGDRLRMVYIGDEGHELFTSHAWRKLFEIRALLVQEFILEFFSTYRMSDTEKGLDVADTLCFQLGGVRRRMTWRWFVLVLGLHTDEEIAEVGFGAYCLGSERVIPDKGDLRDYWIEISSDRDFLGPTPSYVFIQDPVRRLCHRMISCSIFGRGRHLRSTCLGMLRGERVELGCLGGHFIGCLASHFRLVNDQGLRGLLVVTYELSLIDLHERGRLNIYVRVGDTWSWVTPGPESAGTLATTTCPQDYATEDFQAQGGGTGAVTVHYEAARRC